MAFPISLVLKIIQAGRPERQGINALTVEDIESLDPTSHCFAILPSYHIHPPLCHEECSIGICTLHPILPGSQGSLIIEPEMQSHLFTNTLWRLCQRCSVSMDIPSRCQITICRSSVYESICDLSLSRMVTVFGFLLPFVTTRMVEITHFIKFCHRGLVIPFNYDTDPANKKGIRGIPNTDFRLDLYMKSRTDDLAPQRQPADRKYVPHINITWKKEPWRRNPMRHNHDIGFSINAYLAVLEGNKRRCKLLEGTQADTPHGSRYRCFHIAPSRSSSSSVYWIMYWGKRGIDCIVVDLT